MRKKVIASGLVTLMVAASILSGCGSSKQVTTTEAVTAVAAEPAEVSAELLAELSAYTEKTSDYSVEGATKIDVKTVMQGKKIFIIPGNYTVKFSQTTCDNMKAICDSMGIEATIFPTDGTSGKWVEGMEQAVNQGYDAILCFSGVTMEEIEPQVENAKAAGIPVIDLHFHDFTDADTCKSSYCLPANYKGFGYALGLYAISQNGADGDYLIVKSDDLTASVAMEKGIDEAFAKYAPNAKVTKKSVTCPDWSTKIQTEVQNALNADSDISYVVSFFDSTLLYVTAGIEGAGRSATVKCNGYNGTPDILNLVNEGSVDADLGECLELMAYCCLDQTFRILSGSEPLKDENPPMYFWTKDNIADALDESGKAGFGGYDNSYIAYYEDLWSTK